MQWLDWTILGIMLMTSALIGVYYRFTGGKQKTSEVILVVSILHVIEINDNKLFCKLIGVFFGRPIYTICHVSYSNDGFIFYWIINARM